MLMDITWMLTKEDFARVKHTVNAEVFQNKHLSNYV